MATPDTESLITALDSPALRKLAARGRIQSFRKDVVIIQEGDYADTLYVNTNLGTVAAVEVQSGAIRWLRTYARDVISQSFESTWANRTSSPWATLDHSSCFS